MLETGWKHTKCLTVAEENTAESLGSGTLPVLGTPAMIALMEGTAMESVEQALDAGMTTVGTEMTVRHLSPDPVGVTVICESELINIDGRLLTFALSVRDHAGVVGEATHVRCIVRVGSFMEKAKQKRG